MNRKVFLDAEEVNHARYLGVSLELYARHKWQGTLYVLCTFYGGADFPIDDLVGMEIEEPNNADGP